MTKTKLQIYDLGLIVYNADKEQAHGMPEVINKLIELGYCSKDSVVWGTCDTSYQRGYIKLDSGKITGTGLYGNGHYLYFELSSSQTSQQSHIYLFVDENEDFIWIGQDANGATPNNLYCIGYWVNGFFGTQTLPDKNGNAVKMGVQLAPTQYIYSDNKFPVLSYSSTYLNTNTDSPNFIALPFYYRKWRNTPVSGTLSNPEYYGTENFYPKNCFITLDKWYPTGTIIKADGNSNVAYVSLMPHILYKTEITE